MDTSSAQILESSARDEAQAISEIKDQLSIDDLAGVIFFCSSIYDLEKITSALNQSFDCPVVGCTTAGEITSRYLTGSIVALAFSSNSFALHNVIIDDIDNFNLPEAMQISNQVERKLQFSSHLTDDKMFGFLLADGLSTREENLISKLHQSFEKIEIFGGSAGDDLALQKTHVFFEGKFHEHAAVMSVVELKNDFQVFRIQHFTPTEKELITTEVEYGKRIVKEINGEPAAVAYAKVNGLNPDNMTSTDFATYPLMLSMGGEWYIRSILSVGEDQSLTFYCAIEEGLPLSIGSGQNMVENLKQHVDQLLESFDEVNFTLGFDCILRRVEILNKNHFEGIEASLSRLNFVGFSSYGEQSNGVHFNQTFTGIIVGKKSDD